MAPTAHSLCARSQPSASPLLVHLISPRLWGSCPHPTHFTCSNTELGEKDGAAWGRPTCLRSLNLTLWMSKSPKGLAAASGSSPVQRCAATSCSLCSRNKNHRGGQGSLRGNAAGSPLHSGVSARLPTVDAQALQICPTPKRRWKCRSTAVGLAGSSQPRPWEREPLEGPAPSGERRLPPFLPCTLLEAPAVPWEPGWTPGCPGFGGKRALPAGPELSRGSEGCRESPGPMGSRAAFQLDHPPLLANTCCSDSWAAVFQGFAFLKDLKNILEQLNIALVKAVPFTCLCSFNKHSPRACWVPDTGGWTSQPP